MTRETLIGNQNTNLQAAVPSHPHKTVEASAEGPSRFPAPSEASHRFSELLRQAAPPSSRSYPLNQRAFLVKK